MPIEAIFCQFEKSLCFCTHFHTQNNTHMKRLYFILTAVLLLTVSCNKNTYDKDGTSTISSVTIPNVPFQRNRSTEYSGNLFTNNGSTTLTLNDTWGDPFIGTW